jgi:FKBP-type peptidyl-prolyl cis-trans isomerase SlyD
MFKNDQVVSIHYKLTNDAGEVIDSSEGRDPLKYLQGHGNIVPGLEKEMTGKAVGDKFDVVVPPEEGYGVRDDTKIGKVPRAQVEVEDLEIGTKLQAETPEGVSILTVLEVSDEEITLDANHELAGMTLNFVIEVAEVRDAEQVEIDHGHVH